MAMGSRASSDSSASSNSLDSSNLSASTHSRSSTTSIESYLVDENIGDDLVNLTPCELRDKIISFANDIIGTNKFDDLNNSLTQQLDQLVECLREISCFASDYDYKGIPANGYRTILRLFVRMLDITSHLTSKRHRMQQFIELIGNFNPILIAILDLRVKQLQGIDDPKAHRELLTLMFGLSSDIMKVTLNGKYLSMNIPKYKWLLKLFIRGTAMVAPTASAGKKIKSHKFDRNTSLFIDTIRNTKLTRLATYLRILDMPISRSFGSLLRSTVRPVNCSVKRYSKQPVPSYYKINLTANGTQLVKRDKMVVKKAKFSILKNQCRRTTTTSSTSSSSNDSSSTDNQCDDDNTNKVMIYLHGGAFVGPSANCLENLYIKDFASACNDLTLINFDYPLCPEYRFPVALELLLDFYLWLTNETEQVEKILGFKPKDIILSGDSSGANLSAALLVLLNDIRRDIHLSIDTVTLHMPCSLALFMPKMVIKLQFVPSLLYTLFDPILSSALLLRAGEMYMPIRKKDTTTGQWKLITGRRTKGTKVDSNCPLDTDFIDDGEIHEDIPQDYVAYPQYDFVPSCYHSPLDYPHLNELSHVKLVVLSTPFDPLMDESIEVVRKWPGHTSLYVVDPCIHGAYGASLMMPKATSNLMEACTSVIRDACLISSSSSPSSSSLQD